jgi:hypothetical protein
LFYTFHCCAFFRLFVSARIFKLLIQFLHLTFPFRLSGVTRLLCEAKNEQQKVTEYKPRVCHICLVPRNSTPFMIVGSRIDIQRQSFAHFRPYDWQISFLSALSVTVRLSQVEKATEISTYHPKLSAELKCIVETYLRSIYVPAILYTYTNLS